MKKIPENKKNQKKRTYEKPKITKLGNMTTKSQTFSKGGGSDGGSFPTNLMMCLTPPPAIEEHRVLVSDQVCQEHFAKIIMQKVKPGDVVLDLGCGSGVHSMLAAKAGAKKVYAVDGDQIIHFTKKVIAQNGLQDIVTCLQGDFFKIELPEKVDVIISNLGFLQSLTDLPLLKEKFLKPQGIMIPDQLGLEFSLAALPDYYQQTIQIWQQDHLGLDFSELQAMAINHPQYLLLNPSDLVSTSTNLETISLGQEVTNFQIEQVITVQRDETIHGIGGWYSFLCEGQTYLSLAPPVRMNAKIWTNFLLPIERPLHLRKGDEVQINIEIQRYGQKNNPLWIWKISKNGELISQHSNFATTSNI